MEHKTLYIPADYRIDYKFRDGPGPLLIFLHGYAQNANSFYNDVKSALPAECAFLFPNGPFPMPGQTRTIDDLGYAWYFYDAPSDQYYIPYTIPAGLLKSLIEQLGQIDREKIIIGFSQGGYLAPFLAEVLTRVKHVVSINSSFRNDFMQQTNNEFLVHAINGADDNLVDPNLARERHQKLKSLNRMGDFSLIPETKHRINDGILEKLKTYLR